MLEAVGAGGAGRTVAGAALRGDSCNGWRLRGRLVHRPRLLLADEPTGNLDPSTAALVMDLLEQQAAESGAALILVTHSAHAAARASRVLHLTADGLRLSPQASLSTGQTPR